MPRAFVLRLLRSVAIAVVVAAIIDPAITSSRNTRPLISVVARDSLRDAGIVARIARVLNADFTVLHAANPAAAGSVIIGTRIPDHSDVLASPVIAIGAAARTSSVALQRLQAPARANIDTRINVVATAAVRVSPGSASSTVTVELAHGITVVATESFSVSRDSAHVVSLVLVPTNAGSIVLQVRAFIEGAADTVRSDLVVDVHHDRWSVLFFDRRPSWMSTFVRRALERDPRFAVTSRVITSTNVSRETGRAPLGLDELAKTGRFDAVVIGAPDALLARDVDGISTMLRVRGVSVLMLADHAAAGPADALLDISGWRTTTRRDAAAITSPSITSVPMSSTATYGAARDAIQLNGLAIGVPTRLPRGAEVLAVLREPTTGGAASTSARASSTSQPVIWRVPVGRGQLVVSGAFDAWRFRDPAQSSFDATWRDLIDEAANASQAPLDLQLSPTLIRPRGDISVVFSPRDSTNAYASSLTTTLRRVTPTSDSARSLATEPLATLPFSLSPGAPGSRFAAFRAPRSPGAYEVVATHGADTARASFVVAEHVARDADDTPALMTAWSASRGGRVLPRDQLDSLPSILRALVRPVARATEWHPMRSPWWIVPFALALGAEWWLRRRHGLA